MKSIPHLMQLGWKSFFLFFLVWMSGPSSRQVFFIGKIFVHVFSLLSNQLDGKI